MPSQSSCRILPRPTPPNKYCSDCGEMVPGNSMISICYKGRAKFAILAQKRKVDSDQTLCQDEDITDYMKPSPIQQVLREGGSTSNLDVLETLVCICS